MKEIARRRTSNDADIRGGRKAHLFSKNEQGQWSSRTISASQVVSPLWIRCSQRQSLMLCTCCLLMLSRIILRDGLLRVIWTKRISTLICQKCRGLLVINDIMFSTTYNYLVRKSVKWSTFQARITSHFGGTGKSFNYTFS